MCKYGLAAALLVLAAAGPVAAQSDLHADAARRAAEYRARIDSLLPLLEAENTANLEKQRRELEQKRALEFQHEGKLDTVAVGPLLVVGRGAPLRRATRLVRLVWRDYEPLLGATASRLQGEVFVVQGDRRGALARELVQRPRHHALPLASYIQRQDHETVVRGAFGGLLYPLLPARLQSWIGNTNFADRQQRTRTYRELALGNSIGGTRCLAGDVDACTALLGLVDAGVNWSAWYTPDQLRARVFQQYCRTGCSDYYKCVNRADDAACSAAFSTAGAPSPLAGSAAYASVLEYVVMYGGAGSFERLVRDSTAGVHMALVRAAGGPLAPAIAGWQAAVIAMRPRLYADLGRSLLITLVWCGLLVTLAMRSTRWRIG